jgi:PPOX class probable F420-dependent enzyme
VHGDRELVELDALAARQLSTVLGLLAVLEALQHLAVALGVAERVAARVDLGVEAVEAQLGILTLALEGLDPALVRREVGGGEARAGLGAAGLGGGGQGVAGGGEQRRTLHTLVQRSSELLLGLGLDVLAQLANALEAEGERLPHAPVVGPLAPRFSLMDACRTLPDWGRELLEHSRVGRLGLTDDDGAPRVLPVTYALVGDSVVSAVDDKPKRAPGAELARVRWLRARPQAALTVDHYDDDWSRLAWVQVLGRVEITEVDAESLAALRAKYAPYRERAPRGPLLVLRAQRALCWRATPADAAEE